ncbi:MAG: metallophosphoesterase [Bacteroidota bacterium]
MGRLGFLLFVLILMLSLDWYAFTGLELILGQINGFSTLYWSISLLVVFGFIKVFQDIRRKSVDMIRSVSTNFLMGAGFSILVGKIVFIGLLLIQDLVLVLMQIVGWVISLATDLSFLTPERNPNVVMFLALLAGITVLSMLYGITFGKYRFKVEKVNLKFPDLPKAFDGFKILQISDVHAGSFDSLRQVQKGIEMIKAQKADLIVFTGDLVNSLKEEINPYIEAFSALSAPFGMFSILGNHDYYGMYQVAQRDPNAQKEYMDDFNKKHEQIGFKLLNNESARIEKDGESIRVIGVENWGAGPFPKNGDLNKALEGVEEKEFSVLLSHDPTHWDFHVLPHLKKIHLTLSGHTHGMQFGINLPKFKWSPVKYRYKRWMGLYEKAEQYLYVNRGFGFLAWPGRVGMSPEITILELKSS